MPELKRPGTHDKRPGMGTPEEMWKYRLAQRVVGLRALTGNVAEGGLSQHELARRIGVAQSVISRIEAGEGCRLGVLMKLSRLFGVSTDFLLGRAKVPHAYHELVDRARDAIMSVAVSMEYTIKRPDECTIRDMANTIEMMARAQRHLVDLAFQLQRPDRAKTDVRVPYGYEFVEKMELAIGYELDR